MDIPKISKSNQQHRLTTTFHALMVCCHKESIIDPKATSIHNTSLTDLQKALSIVMIKLKHTVKPLDYPLDHYSDVSSSNTALSKNNEKKSEEVTVKFKTDDDDEYKHPLVSPLRLKHANTSLPTEILESIFSQVQYQNDIATISSCSRKFNILTNRLLNNHPVINSTSQFDKLTESFNQEHCLRSQVKSITFLPCHEGTLSGKPFYESKEFNNFHSALFRLLISQFCLVDSMHDDNQNLPHKLLFDLLYHFPKLERLMEYKVGVSSTIFSKSKPEPLERGLGPAVTLEEGGFSNVLLDSLFRKCKWLLQLSKQVGLERFHFNRFLEMSISYLELANYRVDPRKCNSTMFMLIQHQTKSEMSRIGCFLFQSLTGAILDQIKYMTFCSQKMLDCFRSFSLSRRVELNLFAPDCKVLDNALPTHKYHTAIDNMKKSLEALKTCFLRENESLADVFYRLTATEISASCMDSETAEWIDLHLNQTFIPFNDPEHEECVELLHAMKSWLSELVHWHKISKQLESVRAVLKHGLSQLEFFRKVQENHQVVFMK